MYLSHETVPFVHFIEFTPCLFLTSVRSEKFCPLSAIRSKNTKPELALRRALWAEGLRYRIHFGKEKIDVI